MSVDRAWRVAEVTNISRKESPAPKAEGLRAQSAGTTRRPVSSSVMANCTGPPVGVARVMPAEADGARALVP